MQTLRPPQHFRDLSSPADRVLARMAADLAETEASDDTPVPAPTGAHWGPRPAEVPTFHMPCGGTAVGQLRRAARRRRVKDMCATYLWRGVAIGMLLGAPFAGLVIGMLRGLPA